jgi:hypothetical protein
MADVLAPTQDQDSAKVQLAQTINLLSVTSLHFTKKDYAAIVE